jgi:hypothetical protein
MKKKTDKPRKYIAVDRKQAQEDYVKSDMSIAQLAAHYAAEHGDAAPRDSTLENWSSKDGWPAARKAYHRAVIAGVMPGAAPDKAAMAFEPKRELRDMASHIMRTLNAMLHDIRHNRPIQPHHAEMVSMSAGIQRLADAAIEALNAAALMIDSGEEKKAEVVASTPEVRTTEVSADVAAARMKLEHLKKLPVTSMIHA